MNASSSFEPALIGGPCSFAFSLPPIANAIMPKVVPRVAIESCENSGCQETLATLVEDERKRETLGEKMEETHNMGADLTTEDCVLGDHTREFQWVMRRYFELNVPINESKIRGLRSSVGSAARVKARAGLAGRAIAGSFRGAFLHERLRARDPVIYKQTGLGPLEGLSLSSLDVGKSCRTTRIPILLSRDPRNPQKLIQSHEKSYLRVFRRL